MATPAGRGSRRLQKLRAERARLRETRLPAEVQAPRAEQRGGDPGGCCVVSTSRSGPVAPAQIWLSCRKEKGWHRWLGEVTSAQTLRLRQSLNRWVPRPAVSGCGRPCSVPALPGALPAHTCPGSVEAPGLRLELFLPVMGVPHT